MSLSPALLPATELLRRYRLGTLSPVEVVEDALDRIERINPALNAIVLVDSAGARRAARASEARWAEGRPAGALDGVPVTVKDLLLTKGWPTLRGSRTIDPRGPWPEDAPSVARLREAGAIFLGKTATPEFGWKTVTDSTLMGVTCNPWNPEMTAGGSSGGAAVAAATGMGALHLGTDGGGSIRLPAAFTGIVGFKPSYGRVPAYPPSPFGTLAHVGPMTRTVADAALMFRVIAQPDARDGFALPLPDEDFLRALARGTGGRRVGVALGYGDHTPRPEVADAVAQAAGVLAGAGCTVQEVELPFDGAESLFETFWSVGAAALLAGATPDALGQMDRGLVALADRGAAVPLIAYMAAQRRRAEMAGAAARLFQSIDLLLTPTVPIAAYEAGRDLPRPARTNERGYRSWWETTPLTIPFNLTQQPAISVPFGLTRDGLPIGVQIVGPLLADSLVLRAAAQVEAAAGFVPPRLV